MESVASITVIEREGKGSIVVDTVKVRVAGRKDIDGNQ